MHRISRHRAFRALRCWCFTFPRDKARLLSETSSSPPSTSPPDPKATKLLTRWNIGGPRADQVLASHQYWDSFYLHQSGLPSQGKFDWYVNFSEAQELIEQQTCKIRPSGVLLHLGCGTSDFSAVLSERHPSLRVVHGDFSAESLRIMNTKHPGLLWIRMDAKSLPFADGEVDCVIEKGTMDALLRAGDESWFDMCTEVLRVLKPGGSFVQITDEPPELRLPLLEHLGGSWSVSFRAVGDPDAAEAYFLYRCSKL